ncbi:MAG: preprotein translocase subunit YajC [Bdellovibrionota bacterium]|nr:preprotein translocase subunit YajC [Pseudomonadota bacterium]MDY6089702.1 preprotein translocase subunit YajC [Bdellovibrionota bacterium]
MKYIVNLFVLSLLVPVMSFSQVNDTATQASKNPSMFQAMMNILPLCFIVYFIFYFFVTRPQEQLNKQKKEMLGSLKKGDEVVTSSGIYGRIDLITDETVLLEVFQGTKIKFNKDAIVKKI